MTLEAALDGVLLVAAAIALLAAGARTAALAAPASLATAVGAVTLASAAAIVEALALGLAGLGGTPIALAAAAVLTWAIVRALVRAPDRSLLTVAVRSARRLPVAGATFAGAVLVALCAWTAYTVARPALGFDTVLYHLSEAVLWIQDGTIGTVEPVIEGLPVGAYPLSGETLTAWAVALAQSFVPVTLVNVGAWLLLGAGAWLLLAALRVPRLPAALAVGAVVAAPAVAGWQVYGNPTDPLAFAFLAACAGLAAAAVRERPALLALAIVAAGLAIGVKTTVAPLAVVAIAWAAVVRRRDLRALAPALGGAVVLALLAGGVWYARNLADHGSPLWPFVATPWGDQALEFGTTFLEAPRNTIEVMGERWLEGYLGGLLLLAGGLLAPLLRPRREVVLATAAMLLAALLWTRAPFTGVSPTDPPLFAETSFSTTRYLLPAAFAGALALGLAARAGGARAAVAAAVLGAALCANVVQTFELGTPGVPPTLVIAAAALAGAAAGAGLALLVVRRRAAARPDARDTGEPPDAEPGPRRPRAGVVPALVAAGVILLGGVAVAAASDGYVDRHLADGEPYGAPLLRWLAAQPGYADGERPVATARAMIALTAGDRLEHPLEPIGAREDCARVRERVAAGWVVVYSGATFELLPEPGALDPRRCLSGLRPAYEDRLFRVYGGAPS